MNQRRRRDAQTFERSVEEALEAFGLENRRCIEEGRSLPRLSTTSFLKSYNLARSTLYGRHILLVGKIEQAIKDAYAYAESIRSCKKKPTVASLRAENIALRASLKKRIAIATSVSALQLSQKLGSLSQDKAKLIYDKQQLLEKVQRLAIEKEQLRNQIASLLSQIANN